MTAPTSTATHIARRSGLSPEQCPESAGWRGELDRYPLSLALLAEAPPAAVAAIRDAHPAAQRAFEVVADYRNHGLGLGALAQEN